MGMAALLKMMARYTGGGDSEVSVSADKQRNVLVAQGNPSYAETRRRGEGWTVMTQTPLTPLAALPTTASDLELWNNGSRVAVVSDLHVWRLLGTAAVAGEVIFAMITTVKAVPVFTDVEVFHSLSGKEFKTSTVTSELVPGVGTTVVPNGWQPYGPPSMTLQAATPGTGYNVPINGKLIIPPGCSLCLSLCASIATGSAFHIGVTFDWVEMTIES